VEVTEYAIDIISTKNITPDLIPQFCLEVMYRALVEVSYSSSFCMLIFYNFIICPSWSDSLILIFHSTV